MSKEIDGLSGFEFGGCLPSTGKGHGSHSFHLPSDFIRRIFGIGEMQWHWMLQGNIVIRRRIRGGWQ
jgi:hypothetical protein